MPKGKPKSILSTAIGLFMHTPLAQAREIHDAGREIIRAREQALMPKKTETTKKVDAATKSAVAAGTTGAAKPGPKKSHKKKGAGSTAPAAEASSTTGDGSGEVLSPEVAAIVGAGATGHQG